MYFETNYQIVLRKYIRVKRDECEFAFSPLRREDLIGADGT